jgi:hypothetical protein
MSNIQKRSNKIEITHVFVSMLVRIFFVNNIAETADKIIISVACKQ